MRLCRACFAGIGEGPNRVVISKRQEMMSEERVIAVKAGRDGELGEQGCVSGSRQDNNIVSRGLFRVDALVGFFVVKEEGS